jgi:hypothetical protein
MWVVRINMDMSCTFIFYVEVDSVILSSMILHVGVTFACIFHFSNLFFFCQINVHSPL